jgi:hypothetical protein
MISVLPTHRNYHGTADLMETRHEISIIIQKRLFLFFLVALRTCLELLFSQRNCYSLDKIPAGKTTFLEVYHEIETFKLDLMKKLFEKKAE